MHTKLAQTLLPAPYPVSRSGDGGGDPFASLYSRLASATGEDELTTEFVSLVKRQVQPQLHQYVDEVVSRFSEIYPAGCRRLTNVGGPGSDSEGWYAACRRVDVDPFLLWDAMGIRGADHAMAAWEHINGALVSPPRCVRHHFVPATALTDLNLTDADERTREWFATFLRLLSVGAHKELMLFRDSDCWYDLIGIEVEGGADWTCIPVPIFVKVWPTRTTECDEMPYNPAEDLLEFFGIACETRQFLGRRRHFRARILEKYEPIKDGRGLERLETVRRDVFGCAVVVDTDEMVRIIGLPWPRQVEVYMAAISAALEKYVATTRDDEIVCPNLPVVVRDRCGNQKVEYTTSTGNTKLRVSRGGIFSAYRLQDGEALSLVHPTIYQLAGGVKI